jgi:hypothetical protein
MSVDYKKTIARYDHKRLQQLWQEIANGTTVNKGWDPGKAFEHLVLRAFQLEGAEIRWPFDVKIADSTIEQIDGVIYSDGLACLIECKDWASKANIEPIAKIRNQLLRRPGGSVGLVFSREGFTDPALTLARFTLPQAILLWTGEEVELALKKKQLRKGLVAKYHRCVEEGLPDYNLREEWL